MRAATPAFAAFTSSLSKEIRIVVELAFDNANTDLVYFTSHINTPVPSGATAYHRTVSSISGTTQKVDPGNAESTIGAITVRLLDAANVVSKVIHDKRLIDGNGIRHKRVRIYVGDADMSWSDFSLVQTQIVNEEQYDASKQEVILKLNDAQRFMREQLFVVESVRLRETLDEKATVIQVSDITKIQTVQHDAGYNDAPNKAVFYVQIDDEIIRCSGSRNDATLGDVFDVDTNGRGALGTYAAVHEVSPTDPLDKRPEIREVVYLEGPAIKLAYELLTGNLYGLAGQTLPKHWHLGVASEYISLPDFEAIGSDIWDTSDPTKGIRVRFMLLEDENGKDFIEQELYLRAGVFSPIKTTGELGLRRFTSVLSGADYVKLLSAETIVSHSVLTHSQKDVANQYLIRWGYNPIRERWRSAFLTDATSISRHGTAKVKRLEFRGMYGGITTTTDLASQFHALRDRFAGPPLKLSVTTFLTENRLEVGDIVRVVLPYVKDTSNDEYTFLDRSFEVQQVKIDWIKGTVTLALFGSSEPASTSGEGLVIDTGIVMDDGFYNGTQPGTSLASVLTIDPSGAITADGTLTGASAIDHATGDGVYWYFGDLTLASGVNLTITDNVEIRVGGAFDVQGLIKGNGAGLPGATPPTSPVDEDDITPGTAGYIGSTESQGGGRVTNYVSGDSLVIWHDPPSAALVEGQNASMPLVEVRNPDGLTLENLPADLRGTSGSSGGNLWEKTSSTAGAVAAIGGAGGAGGAGLRIISRGFTIQPSGRIDLSGADGQVGQSISNSGKNVYAGSGGGGAPGACQILIDGTLSVVPDLVSPSGVPLIRNEFGDTPYPFDDKPPAPVYWGLLGTFAGYLISGYAGSDISNHKPASFAKDKWAANKAWRGGWQRDESEAAASYLARPPMIAPGNGFSYRLVAVANGVYELFWAGGGNARTWRWNSGPTAPLWPTTIGDTVQDGDLTWECAYDVSLSGAGGGNRVQYLPRADVPVTDADEYAAPVQNATTAVNQNNPPTTAQNLATVDVTVTPPTDTRYAYSNIYYKPQGVEAWQRGEPAQDTGKFTVPMDGTTYDVLVKAVNIDGVEAPDGVRTTATVPSGSGGSALGTDNYLRAGKTGYADDATPGFWIGMDGATAKLNLGDASNNLKWDGANLSVTGNISASSGSIGGWTISASAIISPDTLTVLDAANDRIRVSNLAGTNYIDMSGAGLRGYDATLGETFRIPTDGSAPVFASGIVREVTYEMYTSGVLKTDPDPATNGGVLLNNAGLSVYDPSGTRTVWLNATGTGVHEFDGAVVIRPGSVGVANLQDAGDLASQNAANWATQVTGTGKPADNADVTQNKITTGLALTAGYLDGNGGAVRLDFASRYLSINSATFGASGIQLQYNAGNPRMYVGDGAGTHLKYEAGVLSVSSMVTATTGKRVEINPLDTGIASNEIRVFGDYGNGTVNEVGNIGLRSSVGDSVAASFGVSSIAGDGSSRQVGVQGLTGDGYGVSGFAGFGGVGTYGSSDTGSGIKGETTTGKGVEGVANDSGYGGLFGSAFGVGVRASGGTYSIEAANNGTQLAPILIEASGSSAPTSNASVGALWPTTSGVLYLSKGGGIWASILDSTQIAKKVSGLVAADGTVIAGTGGFTIAKGGVGLYRINLSPAMNATYKISLSVRGISSGACRISWYSRASTYVDVIIEDYNDSPDDREWSFELENFL